ncbi:MAG: hypothetical protein RL650_1376 [Pseudomonadota bacterium]|jgi:hypothetical protein
MNKVTLRAITAYTRTDMKSSGNASVSVRGIEKEWLGKAYVLLEDDASHQLMAVYRCMNRGELKRLKRWPPGLTDNAPTATTNAKRETVPAILELSPIKGALKTEATQKSKNKTKLRAENKQQTDLFEGSN